MQGADLCPKWAKNEQGGEIMKFDMHTHTEKCGHAYGAAEDYVKTAIDMGMDVIGISDHCPNFSSSEDHPTPRLKMAVSQFPDYVNEILDLKIKYKHQIEVLLGIESDFIPGKTDLYDRQYQKYPFDYIIGSVHGIDGHSIFARKEWARMTKKELTQIKTLFCHYVQQSARSGAYQILGHIDALKTFIPEYHLLAPETADETLKVIKEEEVVIEVNTSGDKKGLSEWFPSIDILERAYHFGVKVTFGSDAHRPEHLGRDREKVVETLKMIGYKEWFIFRNKKPVKMKLE